MSTTYTHFGGTDAGTAVLTNVLRALNITNPVTGQPFSEAIILGIGGGLSFSYRLWEFRQDKIVFVTLGFRNRPDSHNEFIVNACQRLTIPLQIEEHPNKKRADQALRDLLDSTLPGMMWVDKAQMPHRFLSPHLNGYFSHVIGVAGLAGDALLVDDLAKGPFSVDLDIIDAARGRINAEKSRIIRIASMPEMMDVQAAVRAGLAACVSSMMGDERDTGLPAIERWAYLLTSTRQKKGWLNAFRDGEGLYDAVNWVYEGIKCDGVRGDALRSVYADFLEEAATLLEDERLRDLATYYRELATQWADFADAALPHAESRRTLDKWYAAFRENDMDTIREAYLQLTAFRERYYQAPPIDDLNAHFTMMQEHLNALFAKESEALGILKSIVEPDDA